jgi:hydrogenase maturation protease
MSIKEHGVQSGIRVIGLGNEYRNDDAVGPLVARKLSKVSEGLFSVLELSGEGTQLMEGWEGADAVFLVDATSGGRKAGHVSRIDAWNAKLEPSAFRHSTHAFGIAESIELAKVIGGLPKTCVIFGIEGEDFGSGTNISHPVMQAADKVIEAIVAEIHSMLRSKVPGP